MFQDFCIPILGAITLIILSFLGTWAITVLKKLNIKYGMNINDKMFENIESIIKTIVISYNQTVVDDLKKENNGVLSEEQKTEVFLAVKNMILDCLSSSELDAIIDKYGDTDNGLRYLIEYTVKLNKGNFLIESPIISGEPILTEN